MDAIVLYNKCVELHSIMLYYEIQIKKDAYALNPLNPDWCEPLGYYHWGLSHPFLNELESLPIEQFYAEMAYSSVKNNPRLMEQWVQWMNLAIQKSRQPQSLYTVIEFDDSLDSLCEEILDNENIRDSFQFFYESEQHSQCKDFANLLETGGIFYTIAAQTAQLIPNTLCNRFEGFVWLTYRDLEKEKMSEATAFDYLSNAMKDVYKYLHDDVYSVTVSVCEEVQGTAVNTLSGSKKLEQINGIYSFDDAFSSLKRCIEHEAFTQSTWNDMISQGIGTYKWVPA